MFAPNLAWRDVDLKSELEERVHVPVVVENDANAAAWGEFRFGAGADADDLLLVTVGTGVGGGIVLDGELFRGAFGVAGRDRPPAAWCRAVGRAAAASSAASSSTAAGPRWCKAARDAAGPRLRRRPCWRAAGGDPEADHGPDDHRARAGRRPVRPRRSSAELGRWLGEGIASLAAVLDPAVVVIGGGVSEAGDLLLDPIRDAFSAAR